MAVVTISRGTFSGGTLLAEQLCRRLSYRNIDRDAIVERAATPEVSQAQLREALEEPPGITGRSRHKRYLYLSLIQAALAEDVRAGNAVYHGLAGHLLLRGVPGILRLRIIAPLDYRIKMACEHLRLNRHDAVKHIQEMDQHRRKWTRYLYRVDWEDPALYDFVLNLEQVSIESACDIAAAMVEKNTVNFSPATERALADLAVASRVRADLATNPATANLEVHVESHGGKVSIQGNLSGRGNEVFSIARAVPGVVDIVFAEPEQMDEAWPWSSMTR